MALGHPEGSGDGEPAHGHVLARIAYAVCGLVFLFLAFVALVAGTPEAAAIAAVVGGVALLGIVFPSQLNRVVTLLVMPPVLWDR